MPKAKKYLAYTLNIVEGGNLAELKVHFSNPERHEDVPRGEVKGFSRKSRMRLLKLLNSISQTDLDKCLFVTLTYHQKWGDTKRDLQTFWKRLQRRYSGLWCVWKVECQKRGAPHFHLLIGGIDFIPSEIVARQWTETLDEGEKHLQAGTSTERVRKGEGAKRYASKYMGKGEDGDCFDGRVWGVMGRKCIPIGDRAQFLITEKEFFMYRRVIRKLLKKRGYTWHRSRVQGLSAFIPSETAKELLGCVRKASRV
jgi:hypothetical protein